MKTDDLKKFDDCIARSGSFITPKRRLIYQALAGFNRPISMQQLTSSLSGHMNQATVYRNVDLFEEAGIINKVYTGWKYRLELSEMFRPHHHHLTCLRCGKIIPITVGHGFEQSIASFGAKHGFKVKEHDIELRGLCKNCH